jgi:hypothetical protein
LPIPASPRTYIVWPRPVAEIGEQEIKLFVQSKPGAAIDLAELSRWLGGQLAPYQNPRYIAVVAAFERTPSQRIAKQALSRDTAGCLGPARPSSRPPFHTMKRRRKIRCTTRISVPICSDEAAVITNVYIWFRARRLPPEACGP